MESSTRTTPRKTKKKWSKSEWLLLLAPLLVIGGLALMNFMPQIKRSFQEWREYGSHRPYAVFYAGDDLTYNPIAFSPDGKYLAAAKRGTLPSNNGNHSVDVWDTFSRQKVSSWPIAGKNTFVDALKFVAPDVLDVGLWTGGATNFRRFGERRDTRSGKFLSGQKVHLSPEMPPSASYYAYVFSLEQSSKSRAEKLGHTKLNIKLFTIKTPINVDVNDPSLFKGEKHFVVQWMAQLFDAQSRKVRKPFTLCKSFDRWSSQGASGSSMEFYSSPDGKTLLIHPRTADFFAKSIYQGMNEWIEAFDTTTGRSLWKRALTQRGSQNDLLRAITFSPKSNVMALLITKYKGGFSQGGIIELRNTRTGDTLRQLAVGPSTQNYMIGLYTQFSPDGKLLAVPQDDRLELWDVSDLR